VPHVGENTSVFTGYLARLQCPTRQGREIFNPRIVPDLLIFISVAAARWPGPQGELNLRTSGVLPAYQCQRSASEYANASEEKSIIIIIIMKAKIIVTLYINKKAVL